MDSYREHPSDFDLPSAEEALPVDDGAVALGADERRMHVRAYNYWVSLLDGRDFPSIEDLEPGEVEDFAAHSVLLDFTCSHENPAIPYLGAAIRDECALDDDLHTIADVPGRSLVSRLTDHYLQIIANRAPVGFEAEFDNPVGESICYRGILMPFSSDGDTIDFIYGVISWKHVKSIVAGQPTVMEISGVAQNDAGTGVDGQEPLELTDMVKAAHVAKGTVGAPGPASVNGVVEYGHFSWEDGPLHDGTSSALPEFNLDEHSGLTDRLCAARATAESVKAGEGRTRAALYRALTLAYDFAVAAQNNPEEYAELLEESGVKAQARAPMTPIVKLVFGVDYDKARLTEFAAALSYAERQNVPAAGFQNFIDDQPGGLKALVAAERQSRRPEAKPDTKGEAARARLRSAPPISLAGLPGDGEFALVVTRRGTDGTHEPVAIVEDQALIERAIRRAL